MLFGLIPSYWRLGSSLPMNLLAINCKRHGDWLPDLPGSLTEAWVFWPHEYTSQF